ncbi:MAG: hypothetical protein GX359_03855 [Clostridiales bacterium]|nr:hypothetical protein [Clostridiales bacterium]
MSLFTIIILILLLSGLVAFILSLRNRVDWMGDIDKNEHKLYWLYPMVDLLLRKTGLNHYLKQKNRIEEAGKALTGTNKVFNWQRLYWYSKVSLSIIIIYLFLLMAFISGIQGDMHSKLVDGNYLARPNYGDGDQEVHLTVILEAEHEKVTKNGEEAKSFTEDIRLHVKERSHKKEDLEKFFQDSIEYLEIAVLGENESAKAIITDLSFCRNIPGTSILVEWKPEETNLISRDGNVKNEGIPQDGLDTKVNVILSYQEEQRDYTMDFHIMPKQYTQEEELRMRLEEEIITASERSKEEPWFILPEEVDGYRLSWMEASEDRSIILLGLGIFTAALAWIYKDKDLEKKMKLRKNQMLLDYPEIINKFTLLVTAGMTVKQAWTKIAEDYRKRKEEANIDKRYAYEEMLLTIHELSLSADESSAYEAFGRRTGLLSYMKFGTLIAQNLKKGNNQLCELLSKEAAEAFEERKETAKRLGEEAGIKLLGPMIIMLMIIFIIILIPAFMSFAV